MDLRTWGAGASFVAALVAGIGIGWWHGPSVAPADRAAPAQSAAAGTTALPRPTATGDGIALPLESAGADGVVDSPTPEAKPYQGRIFAIGDSVLAGAASCLARRGIESDAKQSRRITDAVGILEDRRDRLPARILIHLGTNGGATPAELDAVMQVLGPERIVMWSTIQLPDEPSRYTYEKSTNEAIAALVERYDNVRLFDWQAASLQHADWLYAEGIHMTPEGCIGYANLVEPQIRAP